MSKWEHLFRDGEFARRDRIVAGLTLEQVTLRPSAQSHTIYEELWHTNRWQSIMVNRDEALYGEWQQGRVYPDAPPASQEEWDALVSLATHTAHHLGKIVALRQFMDAWGPEEA